MQVTISLPDYNPETGYKFQWEDGFEISVSRETDDIIITANKEGLISLAQQLLYLAQDTFPLGYHLHYDESNSLAEGSAPLIIQKL
ncbi:MAG: hypothetical protein EOP50_07140 [Sphingobacteriales bacterium]|nr:MAG: hypothetical protein EOP50_07140 [Sphingobacteriales bacterium]